MSSEKTTLPPTQPLSVSYGFTTFQKFLLSVANDRFRVRVWVRVRISVGEQFSSGALVLEPFYTIYCKKIIFVCLKRIISFCFVSKDELLYAMS